MIFQRSDHRLLWRRWRGWGEKDSTNRMVHALKGEKVRGKNWLTVHESTLLAERDLKRKTCQRSELLAIGKVTGCNNTLNKMVAHKCVQILLTNCLCKGYRIRASDRFESTVDRRE